MKTLLTQLRRQRGVAAVELALILSACFLIIPLLLMFGRVLWHYNVLRDAAHQSALYVATLPLNESAGGTSGLYNTSTNMIEEDLLLSAIELGGQRMYCDQLDCNQGTVTSSVTTPESLYLFGDYLMGAYLDDNSQLPLTAASTVTYANRELSY